MKKLITSILFLMLCSPAWSASQLKKTICPSACDYTSLQAAVAAQAQNLVAADKWLDLEINGTWASADTTAVNITGYTTDATRYINIYTTGAARHAGIYSTSKYLLSTTLAGAGSAIIVNAGYTTINGLIINVIMAAAYSTYNGIQIPDGISPNTIKNNIVRLQSTVTYNGLGTGIISSCSSGAAKTNYIYNNIVYGWLKGLGITNQVAVDIRSYDYRTITNYFYNNTIYNNDIGVLDTVGTASSTNTSYLKNNISVSSLSSDFTIGTTSTANMSNNLSSDASAPGASSLTSKTAANQFTSVGAGTEDLRLKAGADAIDTGATLSAPYDYGIAGNARSGSFDIGADEYVAAGGGGSTWTGTRFSNFKGSNWIYKKN